ncbi:MAG: hypothetical protein KC736_04780 [Candidatus Moranbacteria bacterium]|nr:hypothetical protein [Candidatus Moranbacteria bacterium]
MKLSGFFRFFSFLFVSAILTGFVANNFSYAQSYSVSASSAPAGALSTSTEEITICTGGPLGRYAQYGKLLSERLSKNYTIIVVNTQGSVENAEKLADGTCDFAIMQHDVAKHVPGIAHLARLFDEYPHMICNHNLVPSVDSIGDLADFPGTIAVAVGGERSGSRATFLNLANLDNDYGKSNFDPVSLDTLEGVAMLIGGNLQCLWFVSGIGPEYMELIDRYKKILFMVEVNDSSFNDTGEYAFAKIPKDAYVLTKSWWGDYDTFAVHSDLYGREDLMLRKPKGYLAVKSVAMPVAIELQNVMGVK